MQPHYGWGEGHGEGRGGEGGGEVERGEMERGRAGWRGGGPLVLIDILD